MRKQIMIVANSDWLLHHFRLPLLKSLEEEGLELILVCPEGKYVDSLKAEGYLWLPWKMDRKSTSPLKAATALANLVQYYWKYKPEAVHHITIQSIFYGSIAARILSVPVVINNFTGLGYLFSESKSAFWLRKITLPILRWATAGERNYAVLLNDQDREELLARKLISEERSRVIPGDGVDLDRFHPPAVEKDQKEKTVALMAARLLWDKGVREYVLAAAALSGDHNQVQFWLAGVPDPGNPTSIPGTQIQEWKDQEVVKFLGFRKDMASLLREVDIAVLPSYHEGVPVFLLEAAAAGLPLVATDLEGCRMVVRKGENGFLIPPGNVENLREVLEKLIEDPDLRKRMGKKSREIVEKYFGQHIIVKQFLKLYRDLAIIYEPVSHPDE